MASYWLIFASEEFLTTAEKWQNVLEVLTSMKKDDIIKSHCLEEKLANSKVGNIIHLLRKVIGCIGQDANVQTQKPDNFLIREKSICNTWRNLREIY